MDGKNFFIIHYRWLFLITIFNYYKKKKCKIMSKKIFVARGWTEGQYFDI